MQGVTAVHMAAQNGHTDVVSLLLSRSAGLLRIPDKHGRTPLHLSAAHGHYDMSLLLIGQGADIDAYDKVGPTLSFNVSSFEFHQVKLL